jgi:hypothetical protein
MVKKVTRAVRKKVNGTRTTESRPSDVKCPRVTRSRTVSSTRYMKPAANTIPPRPHQRARASTRGSGRGIRMTGPSSSRGASPEPTSDPPLGVAVSRGSNRGSNATISGRTSANRNGRQRVGGSIPLGSTTPFPCGGWGWGCDFAARSRPCAATRSGAARRWTNGQTDPPGHQCPAR